MGRSKGLHLRGVIFTDVSVWHRVCVSCCVHAQRRLCKIWHALVLHLTYTTLTAETGLRLRGGSEEAKPATGALSASAPADTAAGTDVPQASATPAVSAASANPVQSVVAANSQLEKQVSELAASYDKVHGPSLLLCFLVIFPSGRCDPVLPPRSFFISLPAQKIAPPQTPCLYGFAGGLRRFLPPPPPLSLCCDCKPPLSPQLAKSFEKKARGFAPTRTASYS